MLRVPASLPFHEPIQRRFLIGEVVLIIGLIFPHEPVEVGILTDLLLVIGLFRRIELIDGFHVPAQRPRQEYHIDTWRDHEDMKQREQDQCPDALIKADPSEDRHTADHDLGEPEYQRDIPAFHLSQRLGQLPVIIHLAPAFLAHDHGPAVS